MKKWAKWSLLVVLFVGLFVGGFFIYFGMQSTRGDIDFSKVPLIKHPGIDLEVYDPVTDTAGAVAFWDIETTNFGGQLNKPYIEFGEVIPANSAGPEKINPQPTFIVKPGSPVYSLIDGEVLKVEQIYSGDYTVHIAEGKFSRFIFETEHVINPQVEAGDKVKAGDIVAYASDTEKQNFNGNGWVETGILIAGNPPAHICPFEFLDPSIKAKTDAAMLSIYQEWNRRVGEEIYDTSVQYPGCQTTERHYDTNKL